MAKRGLGRSNVNADINVTPMADIMLVLLIIFMITTPLLQSGITVNLPKAKNPLDAPGADSKDAVVVALTREGRIYLQKNPISEDDLPQGEVDRFNRRVDEDHGGLEELTGEITWEKHGPRRRR